CVHPANPRLRSVVLGILVDPGRDGLYLRVGEIRPTQRHPRPTRLPAPRLHDLPEHAMGMIAGLEDRAGYNRAALDQTLIIGQAQAAGNDADMARGAVSGEERLNV